MLNKGSFVVWYRVFVYSNDIIIFAYSKTCLKRTPTGPNQSVRFRQVSALERFG